MRAAIVNLYLDTLGGGERYSLAVAHALVSKGYTVDVQWKSPSIKKRLEDRFGIDLEGGNFVKDVKRGDGYDVCFWVSDGSVPTTNRSEEHTSELQSQSNLVCRLLLEK